MCVRACVRVCVSVAAAHVPACECAYLCLSACLCARAAGSASKVRTRSSRSLAEVVDDGDAGLEWSGVPVAVHSVRPLPAHCFEVGLSGSAGRSLARIGGAVLARRHGSARVRMMRGGPLCAGMPSRASAGLRPRHRCRHAKSRISARAVGACHRPPASMARRSLVSVGVGRWNLPNGFALQACAIECVQVDMREHIFVPNKQEQPRRRRPPSLLAARLAAVRSPLHFARVRHACGTGLASLSAQGQGMRHVSHCTRTRVVMRASPSAACAARDNAAAHLRLFPPPNIVVGKEVRAFRACVRSSSLCPVLRCTPSARQPGPCGVLLEYPLCTPLHDFRPPARPVRAVRHGWVRAAVQTTRDAKFLERSRVGT